jgi:GH24 family phage-related lysozyme (muramidase)
MHTATLAGCLAYQERFEGRCDHMYLDIRGHVTVGVGNLIDAPGIANGLPFRWRVHDTLASPAEIGVEWHAVKDCGMSQQGAAACLPFTQLYLLAADIESLVENAARSFVTLLRPTFPCWDDWPVNAQLATLGVCWAVGAGSIRTQFPRLVAACNARDWGTAARECSIKSDGNPGVIPRNRANRDLFLSSLQVEKQRAVSNPNWEASLRGLGNDWDSYGGLPIAEKAIQTMVRLLAETPTVVPTCRGGLMLEWDGALAEIEIDEEGNVIYN